MFSNLEHFISFFAFYCWLKQNWNRYW